MLITDSHPNQNGAGISQTLYNLLNGWPHDIMVLVSKREILPESFNLSATTLSYNEGPWQPLQNRFGKWINGWLQRKRLQWLQNHGLESAVKSLPFKDDCFVLVSTTVPEKLLVAYWLLQKGYRVLPYFMDDWLNDSYQSWKSGSVQQVAADLLRKAPARLMISSNLQRILEQRYQLPAAPTLVIHNPSPPPLHIHTQTHTSFPPSGGSKGGTHTSFPPTGGEIIYAGSIWPMHADALIAVAKAIQLLNASGKKDFSLCIYTSQGHWEKYKSMLQGEGVHWGEWLPYDEVRKKFSDAFLLLCTASFEKAQQAFTNSSVQTKLTDYIAAGRPVLVVAPTGAASGEWVLNETCGYWLQTHDPAEIATQLQQLAEQPFNWQQKAEKALALASTTYSTAAVQQRLYQFLSAHG